jgi:hypothetical protein
MPSKSGNQLVADILREISAIAHWIACISIDHGYDSHLMLRIFQIGFHNHEILHVEKPSITSPG